MRRAANPIAVEARYNSVRRESETDKSGLVDRQDKGKVNEADEQATDLPQEWQEEPSTCK